jgi:acyl-CoA thioester hydrolase
MTPDHDDANRATALECTLRVRYGECDPQGVVFNAHFLSYFDIAVTELFRAAFGGYQAMTDRGVDFVVAEAGLRYRAPAHFDDELTLTITVTRIGTTSLTTRYRIRRDDDVLVEGDVRHVLIDRQKLARHDPDHKAHIPTWMRQQLQPYVAA